LPESFPAPDKALLAQPQIASAYRRDSVETLCQGHDAASTDFILAAKDWNFDLEEIRAPVHIWNGEEDINAPPAMADTWPQGCHTTESGGCPVQGICACSAIGRRFSEKAARADTAVKFSCGFDAFILKNSVSQ
jgi:hypothetical protein